MCLILRLEGKLICNLDLFFEHGIIIGVTKSCFFHGDFSTLFQTFLHIYFFVNPFKLNAHKGSSIKQLKA